MTKEEKKELFDKLKEEPLEKGDVKAMIIAALLNILPVVLLIIAAFIAIIWFFFLR